MERLSKDASDFLKRLRATAEEADGLATRFRELGGETRNEVGAAWSVNHFVTQWLTALPEGETGITLAEWLRLTLDYAPSLRHAWPTSPWGLWRRALTHWMLYEGGVFHDEHTPPAGHAALRVLAGYGAVPARDEVTARSTWDRLVKQSKDSLRHEKRRQKPRNQAEREQTKLLRRVGERQTAAREAATRSAAEEEAKRGRKSEPP